VTGNSIFERNDDADRFEAVIDAVAGFVGGRPVVTGSFAVEWNIGARDGQVRPRKLNDIDLVVGEFSEILSGIAKRFLIIHFHPTRERGNLLMQLVDRQTRTRVDIFSARSAAIFDRALEAQFGGIEVALVSAEDLAARLLAIIAILLDGRTVDPKYVDSFTRLLHVVDRDVACELWKEYSWGNYTDQFLPTANKVIDLVHRQQGLLKPIEYSQNTDEICQWCIKTDEFPIADRKAVFEMLGYV